MTDRPTPGHGTPGPSRRPDSGPPTNRGMVAGSLLVGTLLLCAGVGLALGALAGVAVVGLFVGIFAGFPLGIVVVKKRFGDV